MEVVDCVDYKAIYFAPETKRWYISGFRGNDYFLELVYIHVPEDTLYDSS